MKRLFVTGTDTGVGKTWVTSGLARLLVRRGRRVGVFKPLASGDRGDGRRLLAAAGLTHADLDQVNPVYFKRALAPGVAARLEGRRVDWPAIFSARRRFLASSDVLLTEGAGGLMVPLDGKRLVIDLIERWQDPVLLVARAGLGTLNHILLSVEALRRRRIRIAGVLLNGAGAGLAERTNPHELRRLLRRAPLWGVVPRRASLSDPDRMADVLERLPAVRRWMR